MEPGIIAIILFVSIRIVAGLNIPILSTIIRAWWNISFKIASFIPFCGWMAHFIITKGDPQAEAEKAHYVEVGRQTDDATIDMLEQSAEREKAQQAAYEAEQAQREANRRALEDDLRARAYNKYGTRDVHLNSDGSMAKIGNGDYVPVNDLKEHLN